MIKSLPDCLEKSPKVTKIPKKRFKSQGTYPIVSQEKGLINGYWDDECDVVHVDQPFVVFGDHTQVVKLVDFSFVVGADGVKLLKPQPFIDPWYFYYFLIGHPLNALGYARHFRLLKEIDVAVPPLPEQKRIVAILDEAIAGIDTAIANTEKNLANARELFESYLNSVFSQRGEGWITKPLGECFRLRSGDGLTTKQMRPGEFPVFGGNGIAGSHDQSNLSGSNVIIGRVGALCGNARHINESIWLTDNAFKVVDKRYSVDDRFLVYLLNACNLRQYARQAAQPVISNSSLKAINLNFPESESEQRKIVGQLDELKKEIHRVASVYQQKLTALAELKQSLLQKAFSGELTAERAEAAVEEATA